MDYYVSATTSAGELTFLPSNAEFEAPYYIVQHPTGVSPIVINEVLAKNNNGIKDEAGEREDWVELHNTSAAAVAVSGMYITDKYDNPTKWKIPVGYTLAGGGSLTIWCDEDGIQGPLHANFKLSSSGESVMLFATDGKTLLGNLTFGPQQADISTGRLLDQNSFPQVTFMQPTPGKKNFTGAGGTRLYSALDSTTLPIGLSLGGTPKVGTGASIDIKGATANSNVLLMLSPSGGYLPFLDGTTILLGPIPAHVVIPTNGSGAASVNVTIPNTIGLPGVPHYMQVIGVSGASLIASNAMEVIVYK